MPRRVNPTVDGIKYERVPINKVFIRKTWRQKLKRMWHKATGRGYLGW